MRAAEAILVALMVPGASGLLQIAADHPCEHTFAIKPSNHACGKQTTAVSQQLWPILDAATCEYAAKVCSDLKLTVPSAIENLHLPFTTETLSPNENYNACFLSSVDYKVRFGPSGIAASIASEGSLTQASTTHTLCLREPLSDDGRVSLLPYTARTSGGDALEGAYQVPQCQVGFHVQDKECTANNFVSAGGTMRVFGASTVAGLGALTSGFTYKGCYQKQASSLVALQSTGSAWRIGSTEIIADQSGNTDFPLAAAETYRPLCRAAVAEGPTFEILHHESACATGFHIAQSACATTATGGGTSEFVVDGLAPQNGPLYGIDIPASSAETLFGLRLGQTASTLEYRTTGTSTTTATTEKQRGCTTDLAGLSPVAPATKEREFRYSISKRADPLAGEFSVCLRSQVCEGGAYEILPPGRPCANKFEVEVAGSATVLARQHLDLQKVLSSCSTALYDEVSGTTSVLRGIEPHAEDTLTVPATFSVRIDARTSKIVLVNAASAATMQLYQHAVCHRSRTCSSPSTVSLSVPLEVLPYGSDCETGLEVSRVPAIDGAALLQSAATADCFGFLAQANFLSTLVVGDQATSKNIFARYNPTSGETQFRAGASFSQNDEYDYAICYQYATQQVGSPTVGYRKLPGPKRCDPAKQVFDAATCGTFVGGAAAAALVHSDILPLGCSYLGTAAILNMGGPAYQYDYVLPRIASQRSQRTQVCREDALTVMDVATCHHHAAEVINFLAPIEEQRLTMEQDIAVTVLGSGYFDSAKGELLLNEKLAEDDRCMQIHSFVNAVDNNHFMPELKAKLRGMSTPQTLADGLNSAMISDYSTLNIVAATGAASVTASYSAAAAFDETALLVYDKIYLAGVAAAQDEAVTLNFGMATTIRNKKSQYEDALIKDLQRISAVPHCIAWNDIAIHLCLETTDVSVTDAGCDPTNTWITFVLKDKYFQVVENGGAYTQGATVTDAGLDLVAHFYDDEDCSTPFAYPASPKSTFDFTTSGTDIAGTAYAANNPYLMGGYVKAAAFPRTIVADFSVSMKRKPANDVAARGLFGYQLFAGANCENSRSRSSPTLPTIGLGDSFRVKVPNNKIPEPLQLQESAPLGAKSYPGFSDVYNGATLGTSACLDEGRFDCVAGNECYDKVKEYIDSGCTGVQHPTLEALIAKFRRCGLKEDIDNAKTTLQNEISNVVQACATGKKMLAGKCYTCPTDATNCMCDPGDVGVLKTTTTSFACERCPVGHYQPYRGVFSTSADSDNTGCIPCPDGTYQDTVGQASCKMCPVGRSSSLKRDGDDGAATSATEESDCVPGPADVTEVHNHDDDYDHDHAVLIVVIVVLGIITVGLLLFVAKVSSGSGGGGYHGGPAFGGPPPFKGGKGGKMMSMGKGKASGGMMKGGKGGSKGGLKGSKGKGKGKGKMMKW
ncbi:unnamed protein product [Amoebophrya sp. A120]|nr:unnamed protein product [Amoebophrya sp. A120]|eukprot:GSA120T00008166001.1